jgi:hypothetical protein
MAYYTRRDESYQVAYGDASTGTPSVPLTAVVEGLETAVVITGGECEYSVTSSGVTALDPPSASYDWARLRVRRTSGDAADDSRTYLFYTQDGTTPQADGDPAHGFLVHLDVFLVKLADAANFKMIAQTSETFSVHAEWLRRPVG